MSRIVLSAVMVAAVVVGLVAVEANAGEPRVVQAKQLQATVQAKAQFPALPGYWVLRQEDVREEIGLTDEQVEKLKELGKKYTEGMKYDWQSIRKLSAEQRREKFKDLRENRKKVAEEITAEIEELLTEDQKEQIEEINFRMRAPGALMSPRVLEAIGLSEEQKEKLGELRQEMAEQYKQIREKTFEQSLDVLTPKQRKKLKELGTQGFRVEVRTKSSQGEEPKKDEK
jgi:Spy/CpxP family protein refolding chaperone